MMRETTTIPTMATKIVATISYKVSEAVIQTGIEVNMEARMAQIKTKLVMAIHMNIDKSHVEKRWLTEIPFKNKRQAPKDATKEMVLHTKNWE